MTKLDEMKEAINEAEQTLWAAGKVVNTMASQVSCRLRDVDADILVEMKRSLRDFNMKTWEWNNK